MLLGETLRVALSAIRANALRSMLTTLGIIIGVGAVIAMVALGEGAQARVEEQIQAMGTDVLSVRPGQNMFRGRSSGDARLYYEDAEALLADTLSTFQVAPEARSRQQVSYLRSNASDDIIGTWPDFFEIQNMELDHGRIFNFGEVQGRRRVAVLGYEVAEQLETPASPPGWVGPSRFGACHSRSSAPSRKRVEWASPDRTMTCSSRSRPLSIGCSGAATT